MIQTERLELREYTLKDAPFIFKLMNSDGWLKNIGDRNIKTIEDAEAYMQKNYLSSYEKHGFGPYLVSLKEEGTPIGSSGLYKRDNLDFPDVGFAFLPEFGNKGYAFESAQAVMKYASEKLKLQTVVGITLPENTSSVKLLKKLGLSEIGTYKYEDGEELLLFSN
ncbi:GCN5 family acetyltransferase [Aequorivita soesokkakensis]|jgi:RimJ/RimL family protein N-acetyltransferase|uniref:GCN5 family acetyltransferase n=1 Tax=Aequorivita soesokkakensis TaxID=1385699 RepID=A0A1A9LI74_9FLAO|nr:GNAT family N-acetyltransferase [Aequorivita soesokkakensis]OAD92797.1 GCN5 family acetyltransferase [Aequorivita soesokkakensis]